MASGCAADTAFRSPAVMVDYAREGNVLQQRLRIGQRREDKDRLLQGEMRSRPWGDRVGASSAFAVSSTAGLGEKTV